MFERGEIHQSECCIPWAQVIFACIEHSLLCLESGVWASTLHNSKQQCAIPLTWLRAQAETNLALASQITVMGSTKRTRFVRTYVLHFAL